MPHIKNIHKLDLDAGLTAKLNEGAKLFSHHANITFKILSVDLPKVIIEARQEKNSLEQYLSVAQLIDRAKEFFGIIPDTVIHIHPIPYDPPDVDIVDPDWILSQMSRHKVAIKHLEKETGIAKSNLSAWVNGLRPMSQPVRAMFYYYFLRR